MQDLEFEIGRGFAERLDEQDELAAYREEFFFGDEDLIYMDGNSLGRLPRMTAERLREVVEREWGEGLIRGWNAGWYEASGRAGEMIAKIIGAGPGQTIVADSTSVNLFKLAMAALSLRPERRRILSDALNFPSDLYVLQGCLNILGHRAGSHDEYHLDVAPARDGISVDYPALYDAINEDTAMVSLSHVAFKSGFLYDAAAVTEKAHQAGALVLWDLSHSAGVLPIEVDHWKLDLAVGCTYKYLNGGPGAPAFLYVRGELQDQMASPIWGWFGQHSPFAFELDYQPADGMQRFLAGTPPILSLLAMEAGLDVQVQAGIERIRNKSIKLTTYLIYLADQMLTPCGFTLGSPRDPARRGSHISLRHAEGYRINRALIAEMGVLPDFREPDNIRLGLAPLYTSFCEVWEAVERMRRVVEEGRYRKYSRRRMAVT